VTPKLYKASDVCQLAQLQPYVLRSWEKEFPGIGVQKSPDSPRLYRQSDVDQVLQIKQLVFVEGLTVAGARRRLESATPAPMGVSETEVAEVLDALGTDARSKIAHVRDGLRAIHSLLSQGPGEFELQPPPPAPVPRATSAARPLRSASRGTMVETTRPPARKAAAVQGKKTTAAKRRRANA
jgi:DNA-binding transcriptional MerR regulator